MSPRRRIGILFGGVSVEHEVSVVSARGVAGALDTTLFEAVPIAITGTGRWLAPEASAAVLSSGAARAEDPPGGSARLVIDPGGGGLTRVETGRTGEPVAIDVVFSVAHGWGGEDGRIQGLLDLAGIPCVGPGVLGSAVGMDKQIAKVLFEQRGIPVGPWRSILRPEWEKNKAEVGRALVAALGLPLFAKPANGGSSVGISKIRTAGEVTAAMDLAFAHDRKVVVEAGLDAREIECAVLGNDAPEASVCGEIVPAGEFYDYASKYQDASSKLFIPAELPEPLSVRIRRLAVEAFQALELAGMARVDFFVERDKGGVFINEVNTLPGFTPISMYPKLWEATGVRYGELLTRLIGLAGERFAEERRRTTRREG